MRLVPYSLNISRGKIFADFAVLRVISENFKLEIFRPPYTVEPQLSELIGGKGV